MLNDTNAMSAAHSELSVLTTAIFERITDAFIALDNAWHYVYVNPQAAEAFGLNRDELLGKNIWEEFPQAVGSDFEKDCRRAMELQQPIEGAEYFPAWGRWYAHRIYPTTNGIAIFSRDITEQRQTEDALRRSEQRYRSLITATTEMVWSAPLDKQSETDDDAWRAFTGQSQEDMQNEGWLSAVHPSDRSRTQATWRQAVVTGEPYEAEFRLRRQDGAYRDFLERGIPLKDETGTTTEWIGISIDITERRLAERQLQEVSALQQAILDSAVHSIITLDPRGIIRSFNPAAARMLDYTTDEAIGKLSVLHLHDLEEIMQRKKSLSQKLGYSLDSHFAVLTAATKTGVEQDREWTYLRKDGSRVPVLLSVTALQDSQGNVTGSLCIAGDITDRKAWEAERERLLYEALDRADRDPLTGLYNHRFFHKRLEEEAERARLNNTPLAVAMLDMDNFKFFNTVYGHLAGDQVLRQVAQGIQETSRTSDILARFGGDEFALLLPGLERVGAEHIAATLRERMARTTFKPPGSEAPVPISLSIGVAVLPDEATTHLDAVRLADERLRESKTGSSTVAQEAVRLRTELSLSLEGFATLNALVIAVDNKDRYTRHHSEDVLTYGLALVRRMGLDAAAQHTFSVAALLHDLGKIGVSDSTLRKPGPLNEEELASIRQCPTMGALIVGAVSGFEDTLDAIRHHHERWDGQGYPGGLQEEQIPLLARLMAVADAYSAMIADRPYRPALSPVNAQRLLDTGAGSQWDPACVHAFLDVLKEKAW